MLKIVAIVAAVAVLATGGLLAYAATMPDTFRIQRSLAIKAPPEKILPLLDDLHRHAEWSPWEKIDPAMQRSHSGAPRGNGAIYNWDGNKDIGAGRMEILETSLSRILIKLDFFRPFEAHNMAEFTLQPQGDATEVTWAMYGPNPFLSKVMSLFLSMEKMVGPHFEAGLANLKTVVER